jgi:uncharacterized protein YfaS (alpha-2-macroglobulin family)
MRKPTFTLTLVFLTAISLQAQTQARIESFSPQGTVKKIRQVRARISEQMVALGDPRPQEDPFAIQCAEKGVGRWVDGRNWVYDFERDLPAGVRCEFSLRAGLKTLAGNEIGGQRTFSFTTGGPAVISSRPWEGATYIDENQVFILELDGAVTESSVLANTYFVVDGILERVPVRTLTGDERSSIVDAEFPEQRYRPPHLVLVQPRRTFPAGAKVTLVWGRGVRSPSGAATDEDQALPFVVRPPFTATFHCRRVNAESDCIPITPFRLSFSGPVLWSDVRGTVMKGPGGRQWSPGIREQDPDKDLHVSDLLFQGPFPEKTAFTIELPAGVKDDAGRKLENASSFPLTVRTDEYPPLAKFAADFGILELKGKPLLPVTLRNVEPSVAARMMEVTGGEGNLDPPEIREQPDLSGQMKGRIVKVPSDKAGQMLLWIHKVRERTWEDREKSVFGPVTAARARTFSIPKLRGEKPFEVVGIPLKDPGFYVVEIESGILGAALLGQPRPMYVPTTVLVTNLGIHFKRGVESSLVWVTTLDKARPVAGANVQIRDCEGELLWEGRTDRNGMARPQGLPVAGNEKRCEYQMGLLVSAQLDADMAFVHTTWNDGIESWRFQVPTDYRRSLVTAHTIFDRSLFRAGETVHMKHILRRHFTSGFGPVASGQYPRTLAIQHLGSAQRYEVPLKWDTGGIAETTWEIPKEARLGEYRVSLAEFPGNGRPEQSGSFRVEEYRVPLMRGVIRSPSAPQIRPASVPLDLTVTYLAGGPAGNLPVKFRYDVQPSGVPSFDAFEGFEFSNGKVKEGLVRGSSPEETQEPFELRSTDLTLDAKGSARAILSDLPTMEAPREIQAELEFRDPNGEIQTVSTRVPLLPADRHLGLRPESWTLSKEALKFQVAVTDLSGKPVAGAPARVDLLQRKTYSHRKRLVGGFYAYEHSTETRRIQTICEGKTDSKGLLHCEKGSPVSGNVILQAMSQDSAGREIAAHRDVWVAGGEDWWFRAEEGDRIDVIPEAKRYEPGDKARFQVRMPFRNATALVTIEREGVGEAFLREVSGKEPVIEIPVKGSFAPNVYVSVLLVRGRAGGVQPTATVDLGRPAYKLGIAEIKVGWKGHELKVKVASDRPVYQVREKARVSIEVRTADTNLPPQGGEVALAAIDEGLLELMPNQSWDLLQAMMGRRAYSVETSTAQMHVIGKRHFGLKALPQGGGGGRQPTRELFDTLLLWRGRLPLDEKGQAWAEIPLNDSITSFRIVAVATAGVDRFGTGYTAIRSTQDLMIFSGISPVIREGDRLRSEFTVRNATEQAMQIRLSGRVQPLKEPLNDIALALGAGESKIVGWSVSAPVGVEALRYELEAADDRGTTDRLAVSQKVAAAVPARTLQATIAQVDADLRMEVQKPADAIAGRGGIHVTFRPTLLNGMTGVIDYMSRYPYTCLEQTVSKAIALRDAALWGRIMARLPSFLDSQGLAKYFPMMRLGSDVLTSYILAVSHEAGWEIPDRAQQMMMEGLRGFVEGRVIRYSSLPTADLSIRKLAAVEALSRISTVEPALLSSITIEPNLWPTSAVIDWANILKKVAVRNRDQRVQEVQQILRSRLNLQGTTMGFSTEGSDHLWWLMVSTDVNAVRFLLSQLESPAWKDDMPRLVRGALGRQRLGHWGTTVANAWGVLAMEKFSRTFEAAPVTGTSRASLAGKTQSLEWKASPEGKTVSFAWPPQPAALEVGTAGSGRPWATIRSVAAIPLREPLFTGFRIKKSYAPLEQKLSGVWSKGDIIRVRLEMEAQSDMTWVVVSDPIPAGSAILGTGLGRDSSLATKGEQSEGWVWPAFEERSFEAFRAYYQFVPKGSWMVEYTIRLNSEGTLNLPPTRVEALYSPEMFGELPNGPVQVR